MIGHSEDAKVIELLAPLRRLEPLPFAVPERPERRRLRRPVLVAAVFVGALALTGVAIADGVGAFDGIGAAERPQSGADVLDPQSAARLQQGCPRHLTSYDPSCNLVLDSTRLVGRLPSGRNIYVITDTQGDLCVYLKALVLTCGSTLSPSQPTTLTVFDSGPGSTAIAYGVVLDGVTGVSFVADGNEVTVPVKDNAWAYEGHNPALESLTVHYANGSTRVLDNR